MREQIEERLAALRQEFEAGRRMLADLEARQVELQQTLLRIGGAVQVLEELLGGGEPGSGEAPTGDATAGVPVTNSSTADGRTPAGSV
jgi:hypothetical protein